MNKKLIIIFIIILFLIPIFSIDSQNDNKKEYKNTYKIGTVQSLTGDLSYQGKSMSETIKLFYEQVNEKGGLRGLNIEIIEYDDGNNPSIALEQTKKLVEEDNVNAVIGGTSASTALSVVDYISKTNVSYIHYGAGSVELLEKAGDNVFFLKPTVTMEAMILAQFASNQLYARSIMVIYQNDDTGYRTRNAIKAYVDIKNMGIVSEVGINKDKIPYHGILNEIINSRPDAIIMLTYMSETNEILKHLRGHQINIPVVLPSYNLDYISIGTIGKDNWNNTYTGRWFKSPTTTQVKDFITVFKENMLTYPNYYHSIGWALAQVLYESMIGTSFGSLNRSIKSLYSYDEGISARVNFDNYYNVGIDSMYFVGFKDENFYELNTYISPDIIAYYKESAIKGYITEGYEVKENVIDENYSNNVSIILENLENIKKIEEEKKKEEERENNDETSQENEQTINSENNQNNIENNQVNNNPNIKPDNENIDYDDNTLSNPISGDDIEQKELEEKNKDSEENEKENENNDRTIIYEDTKFLMLGNWESVAIGSKLSDTKYDGKIILKLKEDNRYYMDIDYHDVSYTEKINGYWEIVTPEEGGKKYLLLDQFIPQENLCKAYIRITNYGRNLKLIIAEDNDINGVGMNPDFNNQELMKPYTIEFTRALVN